MRRRTFSLTVDLENDALDDPAELGRIVHRAASWVAEMDRWLLATRDPSRSLRDSNGNTVGRAWFHDKEDS